MAVFALLFKQDVAAEVPAISAIRDLLAGLLRKLVQALYLF